MSGIKIKYRVKFNKIRRQKTIHIDEASTPVSKEASRVARVLALAHYVERLIDQGSFKNHSHTAKLLGISNSRMSQVANLTLLAPSIQEKILFGKGDIKERSLRMILRDLDWKKQSRYLGT
jgi:predicted XRE-type DNA-binding protein